MRWVWNKIRKWLGIEVLIEESNKTRQIVYELEGKNIEMANALQNLQFQCSLLPKVTDAGMDVGINKDAHRNWAVFCATGNGQDYVKFVDISSMDYRDVIEMTKRLEKNDKHRYESRTKIDAPLGMKDIFYNERMKW